MARYIDADALYKEINKIESEMDFYTGAECLAALIKMPTADVVEVKHGKWILDGDITECSNCHKEYVTAMGMLQLKEFEHCPKCGAKMDGGKAVIK